MGSPRNSACIFDLRVGRSAPFCELFQLQLVWSFHGLSKRHFRKTLCEHFSNEFPEEHPFCAVLEGRDEIHHSFSIVSQRCLRACKDSTESSVGWLYGVQRV